MWLTISWRNLWRNLRRTLLTIAAISLGHALLIVMVSMMMGFNEMMVEWNALGLGSTSMFAATLVYNTKRTAEFTFDSERVPTALHHARGYVQVAVSSSQVCPSGQAPQSQDCPR